MRTTDLNIAFLIYTYDRVDDAKINMELIQELWHYSNCFQSIHIVHTFNGAKSWYPEKHLEDMLITIENTGHFQGASELIDIGIEAIQTQYPDCDYVIVLAADTWLIDPNYIAAVLQNMRENNLSLATCCWGNAEQTNLFDVGMAVDFFIVDQRWAKTYGMFPIDYRGFSDKYWDLILYMENYSITLEKLLLSRFVKAVYREYQDNLRLTYLAMSKIYRLSDREPVHTKHVGNNFWERQRYWSNMGLITHHEPEPKKQILQQMNIQRGPNIIKLLCSDDLSYYNAGIRRASPMGE